MKGEHFRESNSSAWCRWLDSGYNFNMALGFYSPFLHDFAGKGEYIVLRGGGVSTVIFAVLEVSFWALTTAVKLPWKFLTLISVRCSADLCSCECFFFAVWRAVSDVFVTKPYNPCSFFQVDSICCITLFLRVLWNHWMSLLLLVCVSFTIIGQPRNSVFIHRVNGSVY